MIGKMALRLFVLPGHAVSGAVGARNGEDRTHDPDPRQHAALGSSRRARGDDAVAMAAPIEGRAGRLSEEVIQHLVDRFYARVRRDELLGPVFARALGDGDDAWAAHFGRLYDFWSSVMLTSGRYHGDPFSTHLRLPDLEPAMFDRWLEIFGKTCAEVFDAEMAAAFRERAQRIARSLRLGLFERLPTRAADKQGSGAASAAGGHA